jgi:hypothetical protein
MSEIDLYSEIEKSNNIRSGNQEFEQSWDGTKSTIGYPTTFFDDVVNVAGDIVEGTGDLFTGVAKGMPSGASKAGMEIADTLTGQWYSTVAVPWMNENIPGLKAINESVSKAIKPEGTAQEVGAMIGEVGTQIVAPGAMATKALQGANVGSRFLTNVLGYGATEALVIPAKDKGLIESAVSFLAQDNEATKALLETLEADEDLPYLLQKLQRTPLLMLEGGVIGESISEGLGALIKYGKNSPMLTSLKTGIKSKFQNIGEKAQQRLDQDTGGVTLSAMGGGEIDKTIDKGLAKLAPKIEFAPEGTRANKLPSQMLVKNQNEKNIISPVTQTFIKSNKEANFKNIDTALENNPNALSSTQSWLKLENETMGGEFLPVPPLKAIEYAGDANKMADKLKQLTPGMKAGVDEGFGYVDKIRTIYKAENVSPKITADLFIWGMLSRGAGPVQQESAFIDIIDGARPLIDKAINGTFTKQDQTTWEKTVSKLLPEGSPGKQVTQNVNATGQLLFELGKKVEGTDKTVLQTLHDMIKDPNVSAKQIRREFLNLTEGAGIDNKVVSFILLVAGRDDVLVMDRIQGRHLWDDGTFKGQNIYDGIRKEGTTIKEGLVNIFRGPRGILLTEALEDGIRKNIQKTYEILGRPQDASLGRWHWENWVIEGEQVVSHSTLKGIADQKTVGLSVTEGKPGTYASGARYIKTVDGTVFEYPLSDGSTVFMTPKRQKEFEAFIKDPKNGIVPKGFKVTEEKEIPWYEREGIDRQKLDDTARRLQNAEPNFKTGLDGSEQSADTISGRRSDGKSVVKDNRLQAINSPGNNQGQSSPYGKGSPGANEGDGLLTFNPNPDTVSKYADAKLTVPKITQVDPKKSAKKYSEDMAEAMSKHKMGLQVTLQKPEDLLDSKLYRTEFGGGFSIKPDGEIIAVFNPIDAPTGSGYAMLQLAIDQGGKKLDAFNTYLPKVYETVGMKPVARVKWNDAFAPEGWNKNTFKAFNNGEPDLVLFVYDKNYFGGDKIDDLPLFTEYDDAQKIQTQALKELGTGDG